MKWLSKIQVIFLLQLFFNSSYAQYKVTFLVKQPSVLHSADHLFIAGNFNRWDPADKDFELIKKNSGLILLHFRLAMVVMNTKLQEAPGEKQKLPVMVLELQIVP
jgi:hypothetical protein